MMADLYLPEGFGDWVRVGDGDALTRPAMIQVHWGPDEFEPGSWWGHRQPNGQQCIVLGEVYYRHSDGRKCGLLGRIGYRHHILERSDPLTIGRSLLCLVCGRHGFVRDGAWVETR